MYTGRALKSNIEWLLVRIHKARNRSRLGKSSIIFRSVCWSSRALLCGGIAIVQFVHPGDDLKILPELQCIDDILMTSDILFDKNRLKDVKNILDEYTDQTLPEVKYRQARCLLLLSKSTKDKNERNSLITDAYTILKSALIQCHENFDIHKLMAIILDAYAELDSIKSRIMKIHDIRKHMEYACKLNPNDPISWYFLGILEYGLAELSWFHKKLLSLITQTKIPNGSYAKAFEHFRYAENLKPQFYSKNLLMLGKCSIALQKLQDAKTFLKKVTNLQVINREDQHCQEEAVELLKRIGTMKDK